MKTRLSAKGQVVLPSPLRRKLGLQPGDPLEVKLERGGIVLTPRRARPQKISILLDPITGLPVLTAGPDAPPLSSNQVQEILCNLPSSSFEALRLSTITYDSDKLGETSSPRFA